MLGLGTDLSAVYVRGVTPDSKEEKKAWFDIALGDFRSNLARYERVDSLVIIASAYESANERGITGELNPERMLSDAETLDLAKYPPSTNWSKRHWNNLRLTWKDSGGYELEIVGLASIKGQEGGKPPICKVIFTLVLPLTLLLCWQVACRHMASDFL